MSKISAPSNALPRATAVVLTAGILLLSVPGPRRAAADWLVTTEGGRVETRGPWAVKGKLVVFTAADGTLSSLRATQVDLPASGRATAESKQALVEAAKPPLPAPRKSIRSITDKDVRHPDADAKAAAEGSAKPGDPGKAAAAGETKPAEAAGKSPVSVGTWQKADRSEKDGIEVFGTLNNESSDIATQVGLTVTLYDDGGGVLGSAEATVTSDTVPGRGMTNFRAAFPGVFTFARAKFDIRSSGLKLNFQPAAPGAGKGSGAAPDSAKP